MLFPSNTEIVYYFFGYRLYGYKKKYKWQKNNNCNNTNKIQNNCNDFNYNIGR